MIEEEVKLIAGAAACDAEFAAELRQEVGGGAQVVVAAVMSVRVVNLLETVEIEHQERDGLEIRSIQQHGDAAPERTAALQARQLVVVAFFLDVPFFSDFLTDVADDTEPVSYTHLQCKALAP